MKFFMKKLIVKVLKKLITYFELNDRLFEKTEPGKAELFGKEFSYHYKPAFVVTFEEIFTKGIYTFNTENKHPIIIDCGANMGLSLLFFTINYPNATIYAFEPDDSVIGCLEKNIATFDMKNVELHKKAVWNKECILGFFTDKGMGGRLENTYQNQKATKVKAIRLKDFISDKHVDFLKMDIEGAEFKVIQDCESVLSQIDNIFIEYHSTIDKEQKLDCLLSILKRNGFRYHLSQSFSRLKPFVDKSLICENTDLTINIYGYKQR